MQWLVEGERSGAEVKAHEEHLHLGVELWRRLAGLLSAQSREEDATGERHVGR